MRIQVFIRKSALFVLPFMALLLVNSLLFVDDQGDLARLGYFYADPLPKDQIRSRYDIPRREVLVSDLDPADTVDCDVFVIGDSFSDQGNNSFSNFLANDGRKVIRMDRYLSVNPMHRLVALLNGGFFEKINPEYIVLQSVEREFLNRIQYVSITAKFSPAQVADRIDEVRRSQNEGAGDFFERNTALFTDDLFKIPAVNMRYVFSDKPNESSTYKIALTTDTLFSYPVDRLPVYEDDIATLKQKNDTLKIIHANAVLNKIDSLFASRGMKLIVLISPDKYDLFYPYFRDKEMYESSIFFPYFNRLAKDYRYVNAFAILSDGLKTRKDVYYYDDTHWSPAGAQMVATGIAEAMK